MCFLPSRTMAWFSFCLCFLCLFCIITSLAHQGSSRAQEILAAFLALWAFSVTLSMWFYISSSFLNAYKIIFFYLIRILWGYNTSNNIEMLRYLGSDSHVNGYQTELDKSIYLSSPVLIFCIIASWWITSRMDHLNFFTHGCSCLKITWHSSCLINQFQQLLK